MTIRVTISHDDPSATSPINITLTNADGDVVPSGKFQVQPGHALIQYVHQNQSIHVSEGEG